ncbi:MAG: patatin-like phospholipase family protein, partial [Myxococcales bacterium]|nr:patatin-like phospholipase family protein [Myxococcales bacterium]
WHGDGGVRMTAPLSPALHLGAERILVVATRRARPRDIPESQLPEPYPPPAQIAGILMNAVFLDMLDYDAMNLDRVNELVRALPEEHRQGLRPVELLVIRPSMDLARLSREYEHLLPASFRFLTRGWGTRDLASPDTLSMLLFEAEYAKRLMELGESDASARMDEIARFVRGSDGTYPPGPPGGRPGSGRAL